MRCAASCGLIVQLQPACACCCCELLALAWSDASLAGLALPPSTPMQFGATGTPPPTRCCAALPAWRGLRSHGGGWRHRYDAVRQRPRHHSLRPRDLGEHAPHSMAQHGAAWRRSEWPAVGQRQEADPWQAADRQIMCSGIHRALQHQAAPPLPACGMACTPQSTGATTGFEPHLLCDRPPFMQGCDSNRQVLNATA